MGLLPFEMLTRCPESNTCSIDHYLFGIAPRKIDNAEGLSVRHSVEMQLESAVEYYKIPTESSLSVQPT